MNNRPVLKFLCICLISALNVTAKAQSESNPSALVKTDLMIVDISFGSNAVMNFILVTYPDAHTEMIEIRPSKGKDYEPFLSEDKAVMDIFQRLYRDGWAIESEMYHETIHRAIYILKRPKQ